MNQIKFFLYLTITLIFINCHIKNKVGNENLKNSLSSQGYQKGELVKNKISSSKCLFLIRMNNDKELLDPINLDNFQYQELNKVWIKYNSLRMPNRCENSSPIQIIDIKKREE